MLLAVADQGCLSRIRIFHPGSRIQHKKEKEKNNLQIPSNLTYQAQLESGHKLYKIQNYFVLRTGIEKEYSQCDPKTCY
jgi:hypothetical protein